MTSPAESLPSLDADGIAAARVLWNLSAAALYEEAVRRGEAQIAADGPLVCRTGRHTGRSPNDKFLVREPSSERTSRGAASTGRWRRAHFDTL